MYVVGVVGALGKMGTQICERLKKQGYHVIEIDPLSPSCKSLCDITQKLDLVVDFSTPNQSLATLEFCKSTSTKLIMGTTGQPASFFKKLAQASKSIPILKCDNFSENVNKFENLARLMSKNFDGDISVVEAHHKHKLDSPSGTANHIISTMLKENNHFSSTNSSPSHQPNVIKCFSIRGGTLFGRHEVHFLDDDEEIVLTHTSFSRKPFINGVIKAVDFMKKKNRAGLYSFDDVIC